MEESKSKQRNLYLDIIKGISIVFVVFGHCIQYGNGNEYIITEDYFYNSVFKFIYSFHMPLFMLVSGYLFYYSISRKKLAETVKSRFTQLVIPIVSWGITTSVLIFIAIIILGRETSFVQLLKSTAGSCIYGLWFLWAVFWCSFEVIIGRHFFKDSIIFYLVILVILFFVPNIYNADLYKYMYPYFVAGYMWNKNNYATAFKDKIDNKRKNFVIIYCLITLLFIALLMFYSYNSYIYTSGISLYGKNVNQYGEQLLIDVYRYAIGFVGSAFVILTIKITYNHINPQKHICLLLGKIGRNSLGIYIISGYIFTYVLQPLTYSNSFSYLICFAESVIIMSVSYFITMIISRFKLLNKIYFGGR